MRGFTVAAVAAAVLALLACAGVSGKIFNVGGKGRAWKPGVNFTEWASHKSFHVGDWLWFRYQGKLYDVLEVNATSYEHCISEGFLTNFTRGKGRHVFELTQAKPYYFICSNDSYCKEGMKLAINVTRAPVPVPVPAPAPEPHSGAGRQSIGVTQGIGTLVFGVMLVFSL